MRKRVEGNFLYPNVGFRYTSSFCSLLLPQKRIKTRKLLAPLISVTPPKSYNTRAANPSLITECQPEYYIGGAVGTKRKRKKKASMSSSVRAEQDRRLAKGLAPNSLKCNFLMLFTPRRENRGNVGPLPRDKRNQVLRT